MVETDPYDDYDDYEDDDDDLVLGPDERDRDLLDGSWEQKYYAGRERRRDWSTIGIGIGLLVVLGMLLPSLLIALR